MFPQESRGISEKVSQVKKKKAEGYQVEVLSCGDYIGLETSQIEL